MDNDSPVADGPTPRIIAHDVRGRLTAISGYCDLLLDDVYGPLSAEQHDVVCRMQQASHAIAGLMNDLSAAERARDQPLNAREVGGGTYSA